MGAATYGLTVGLIKEALKELTESVMSNLFTDLDVFEGDQLLREDYEIDEDDLRYFAEEPLLKMKTYYY